MAEPGRGAGGRTAADEDVAIEYEMIMGTQARAEPAEPDEIRLDPFGYWPTAISRIEGLGGSEPAYEPTYVFTTPYMDFGSGRLRFTVRAEDLRATKGTLAVSVNGFPKLPGGGVRGIKAAQIPLVQMIYQGGEFSIEIHGARDMTYSMLGHIYDETDVRASDLAVTVVHADVAEQHALTQQEAQRSVYGRNVAVPAVQLVVDTPPTLADPVSQMCTTAQFREPAYARWTARLGAAARMDPGQWAQVYVLEALERYGLLTQDACGLALGVRADALRAMVEAAGCTVASEPVVPAGRSDFDFIWSIGAFEQPGSPQERLARIEETLHCLNPGGFAVHVFDLDVMPGDRQTSPDAAWPLRRRDIDRLAMTLIASGHEVAQIRAGASTDAIVDGASGFTTFGLIVRNRLDLRGRS